MASRNFLCLPCSGKPVIAEDPGSHTFYAWGTSMLGRPPSDVVIVDRKTDEVLETIPVPQMLCDWCCEPIARGARACAWTFWRDPAVKPEWESEYLSDITETKRHDW
jgi:hypothetical protein